ncbi:hypothetical protein BJX76DRAFT_321396 [Aspergillus varians]
MIPYGFELMFLLIHPYPYAHIPTRLFTYGGHPFCCSLLCYHMLHRVAVVFSFLVSYTLFWMVSFFFSFSWTI